MFGIGLPELLIIMALALIVIGPKKLPEIARALGKGMAEFRKASQELKDSLNFDEDIHDVKNDIIDSVGEIKKSIDDEGDVDVHDEEGHADSLKKDEAISSPEEKKDKSANE